MAIPKANMLSRTNSLFYASKREHFMLKRSGRRNITVKNEWLSKNENPAF